MFFIISYLRAFNVLMDIGIELHKHLEFPIIFNLNFSEKRLIGKVVNIVPTDKPNIG